MAGKGILIGDDGDVRIQNNSLVVGDSVLQETMIILGLNQGEHKFEPLLGPNLIQLIKSKAKRFDFERRVKIALALDNKDYQQIKHLIKTTIK